jgi:hypothetical protein
VVLEDVMDGVRRTRKDEKDKCRACQQRKPTRHQSR